jgi:toxin ParE1/3/4
VKSYAFHPDAEVEYVHAAEYYAAIDSSLAVRFFDEIERLILQIRGQPDRFLRFSTPARRALSRQFPYSVVYLDEPHRVWIVAVMHAKRRPGYWRDRLK